MLETSEPAPTSLTPRQATTSPAMVGRRNCCFSSSEPNLHAKNRGNLEPAFFKTHGAEFTRGLELQELVCQVPGQRWGGHVRLDADGHGDASAADVAQLLRHRHAVAEVQTQASIFWRSGNNSSGSRSLSSLTHTHTHTICS